MEIPQSRSSRLFFTTVSKIHPRPLVSLDRCFLFPRISSLTLGLHGLPQPVSADGLSGGIPRILPRMTPGLIKSKLVLPLPPFLTSI